MKKFVINTLAAVGAIAIVVAVTAAVFVLGFDGGSDYKLERSMASPAGRYKATVYTVMGGGAAGWCSQVVAVNTAAEPFSIEVERTPRSSQVFRANCSAQLEVEWLSETELLIKFAPGGDSGWLSLSMAQTDKSGAVRIEYALAPNKSLQPTPRSGAAEL
jgi:hypothetical protein